MYVSCVQVGYAQQSGGGNYPTGNGVRVKEVDGSPNVPGTQTLVFPNGSLTRAGQTVTVTIASGTTINATDGVIPYRSSATTFADSPLVRSTANVVEQRNSTNAQTFRVYGTTDASTTNFERLQLETAGSNYALRYVAGGTGAANNLNIVNQSAAGILFSTSNTNRWNINSSGHFLAGADNTYDIGASGATRPRNIYAATAISAGPGTIEGTYLQFSSNRGYMSAPSNGVFTFTNIAGTDFSRLQFGGTSASFSAIKRNGAGIDFVLANDTGYTFTTASINNLDKTITAGGTTGDQTINKSSFTVNFAAAASTLTVTNSFVTSNSNIICTVQTNDTTLKSVAAAPGSGSVVLTANAAATAETRVGCVIHN